MAGKMYEKEFKKSSDKREKRKIELAKMNKELKNAPKRTDAEEGAMLRNTTVADSKKATSDLNKAAKKTIDTSKKLELSDYESQLKALLSNKDKLVKTAHGDGSNKYSYQYRQLTKRMKAQGLKIGSLLKNIKKQEREGTFDRGAEDKTKKKLRKKMMDKKDFSKKGAVHAGTQGDREAEIHQKIIDDLEIKAKKQKAKKQSIHG